MTASPAKAVLYIYCHPLPESFHAAMRSAVLSGLAQAGHRVDLLDLYAEGFDPALSAEGRRRYYDVPDNRAGLEDLVERLQAAEILLLQFPTWCFGPPAMLKGFADRVLLPGAAFDISDGRSVRPLLNRIERIVGIVTYGQTRWLAFAAGDYPRRFVTRHLRWIAAPSARTTYLPLYDMDRATPAIRAAFLERLRRRMADL